MCVFFSKTITFNTFAGVLAIKEKQYFIMSLSHRKTRSFESPKAGSCEGGIDPISVSWLIFSSANMIEYLYEGFMVLLIKS
jgi:hypothetical protein